MNTLDLRPGDHPPGMRVAIVAARFNSVVVNKMLEGALEGLSKHGVESDSITIIWVPGCFELPMAAELAAPAADAVICLGAVIRGETAHFDFVARAATDGIREAGQRTGVPVVFGVLTTETLEQAMDRAGGAHGNKGWDAAETALSMGALVARFGEAP